MVKPPAQRQRLDMTKTFTVSVGMTRKEFTLYTSIATRSSKFFQAALSRNWQESHENRVVLAEVHPDVFEGYLQWLNTGVITSSFPISKPTTFDLIEFYILGDFLDDATFCNAVLDDLMNSAYETWPGICSVNLAWNNTPRDSPLRALILEIWVKKPLSLVVEKLVCDADKLDMSKTSVAVVGEGEKECTLYTDNAISSAKFFQAAMDKSWN
ncbi:hypothetical protein MBLNU13_g07885t1 [Cladosporium sp. NU13]